MAATAGKKGAVTLGQKNSLNNNEIILDEAIILDEGKFGYSSKNIILDGAKFG